MIVVNKSYADDEGARSSELVWVMPAQPVKDVAVGVCEEEMVKQESELVQPVVKHEGKERVHFVLSAVYDCDINRMKPRTRSGSGGEKEVGDAREA